MATNGRLDSTKNHEATMTVPQANPTPQAVSTLVSSAPANAAQSPVKVAALSWQRNLLWTSAGTILYAACNWAMLSVIAKLGTPVMVGEFALGLAVTAPVLMLSQMNLRAVLATDARDEHRFRDYWGLRLNATLLGLLVIVGIALAGYNLQVAALIVAVGLAQGVEGISDIYYGLMQRHERMDRITISMALRGPLALAAMMVGVWATKSVFWGTFTMFFARLAVLLLYDAGVGSRDFVAAEPMHRVPFRQGAAKQFAIFWVALPLSSVMLLNSLSTNMPRYFIEHSLGARELGMFSAAASLVAVGNTLINAVGQTVTPKLAKMFAWQGTAEFASFSGRLVMFGVALAMCAVGCSVVLGRWVLTLMFKPEYAEQTGLLTALMLAGGIGYVASLLGYAVTAARSFRPQMPLFVIVTAATLAACAVLIPSRGLAGAAMALGISSAVQLGGLGVLFLRVVAKRNSLPLRMPEPEPNA
jgi:O-antigen/teichoic acid export membrane protein